MVIFKTRKLVDLEKILYFLTKRKIGQFRRSFAFSSKRFDKLCVFPFIWYCFVYHQFDCFTFHQILWVLHIFPIVYFFANLSDVSHFPFKQFLLFLVSNISKFFEKKSPLFFRYLLAWTYEKTFKCIPARMFPALCTGQKEVFFSKDFWNK